VDLSNIPKLSGGGNSGFGVRLDCLAFQCAVVFALSSVITPAQCWGCISLGHCTSTSRLQVFSLHFCQVLHRGLEKTCHFYFFEQCCETLTYFNNFLACDIRKELDADGCSFGHLPLILSLHYLVKCRSHSLAMYSNELILDSACIGSEMINRKATNTIGNCCISKSHTCRITSSLL